MKVKNYEEKEGSIDIVLVNDEEEQLYFWNPNIYNNGKWEINSYIKRQYGDSIFDIITSRVPNRCYLIQYSDNDYSRIIECNLNNIVMAEVIKLAPGHTMYYPNPCFLCSKTISQYLKQDIKYYDKEKNIYSGDLSKSSKALLDYIEYASKYGAILKKMETLFKMDLEQLDTKQEQLDSSFRKK